MNQDLITSPSKLKWMQPLGGTGRGWRTQGGAVASAPRRTRTDRSRQAVPTAAAASSPDAAA